MMPVKETAPSRRFPFFTILLIIANIAVFVYEIRHYNHINDIIDKYGFIPAELFIFPHGIITMFTSMFLHGGLLHLLGNMYFLWLFGDNVESKLGHFRFLFFYLFCGLVAAGTHTYFNYGSLIPTVGARILYFFLPLQS
jgi:membrane associated rhomboid family serine protease